MNTLPGAEPDLVVDSATGVDVSLPVAGPGARAYAFTIDWHIRVVLFLGWYVVAALLYNGRWSLVPPPDANAPWFSLVVIPGTAIYFLYHPILEIAMRGRTPGKRAAGVRIVARDGAAPTVGAHLIRNVFRLVDSFPAFYGMGLIVVTVTRDHVRIGDLAAGTLLIYDRANESVLEHVSPTVLGSQLDASTAEVVNELLLRWQSLDADVRGRLASSLLTKIHGASADVGALEDAALHERLQKVARGIS